MAAGLLSKQRTPIKIFRKTLLLLASLAWPLALEAAVAPLALSGTASLKVTGESTLHPWMVSATNLTVQASMAPGRGEAWPRLGLAHLQGLSLSVEVAGLQSPSSRSLDKNLRGAMEAEKYPQIRFVLASYQVLEGEALAQGVLAIHGVTKTVELKGSLQPLASSLRFKGSTDLLMSDYGVKAPVMFLGTLRVADQVHIDYEFALEPLR